jgi:hypothetical protein
MRPTLAHATILEACHDDTNIGMWKERDLSRFDHLNLMQSMMEYVYLDYKVTTCDILSHFLGDSVHLSTRS